MFFTFFNFIFCYNQTFSIFLPLVLYYYAFKNSCLYSFSSHYMSQPVLFIFGINCIQKCPFFVYIKQHSVYKTTFSLGMLKSLHCLLYQLILLSSLFSIPILWILLFCSLLEFKNNLVKIYKREQFCPNFE